jgi:outer membrane protein assembly factor BamB
MIFGASVIAPDGTLYVGSWDHKLYAIQTTSQGPADSPWPEFHHDNKNTGRFTQPATCGNGACDGWENCLNCVADCGCASDEVCYSNGQCVDHYLKWSYSTGDLINGKAAIGPDGTIYVGSWDSFLYALNPDGTLKWKFETDDAIVSAATIGADGTIYFGSDDGRFYAVGGFKRLLTVCNVNRCECCDSDDFDPVMVICSQHVAGSLGLDS